MKMRRREDGSLPVPGLYDISGSANFANKADFGIVVHRDLKTGRTTISVRKCRFKHLGKIGDAELEYDVPTGLLSTLSQGRAVLSHARRRPLASPTPAEPPRMPHGNACR